MDDERTAEALVEISKGSRNKYEYDERTGQIRLDRVLYSSVHYPCDYGFIVGTRGLDGDPLDVLIVIEEPTFPGCRLEVRPIGLLLMRDEKGYDEKIIAVPVADPRFAGIHELEDLQPHWLREIENFFATYKALQDLETYIEGWRGANEARSLIQRYRRKAA